jgi:hypothetical protein
MELHKNALKMNVINIFTQNVQDVSKISWESTLKITSIIIKYFVKNILL